MKPFVTSTDDGEVDGASTHQPTQAAQAPAGQSGPAGTRAAPARRSQLRLLESALAELSDIAIVLDAESLDAPGPRIEYVNSAFERRLGYTLAEVRGRPANFLIGPASNPETLERIGAALRARRAIREELVHYTKSGELIHLELELLPVFDDEGRCTHFVSLQRSLSERRAAEDALRLSEQRFRLISRATNDAVGDWDIAADTVWWGDGFDEMFGAGETGGCFLAEQWASRIHADDRERVTAALAQALTRGDPAWHEEYRFRHENGDFLWVSARGYILRDESGVAYRMIGAMTDITDRKAVEEQLSLLGAALDSVASPVLIMRLDARIRWVNRAFTEMTGYTWDEAVGEHAATLLLAPSASAGPASYSALWRTLLRGQTWVGELTNERKDAQEYPVHVTIAPVRDPGGKIGHFVVLARDLTESRQHEAHLLRTQRVESIGMMAGGIAHDLNNVLSPILLSVDYLRATETDPERMEALLQMEASARRGASLLRRLLQFARGLDGHRAPLSVRECVQEVADIARSTFPRNIALHVHTDVADDELRADPTQLHQVLMNLCVNARDAMPTGGTLTLRSSILVVDDVFAEMSPSTVPGRYVVFRVSDTGTGMSRDTQAKLFEPFFTTKPVGEGTGLGLSTVSAIVRNHGGFVQVESALDKGTTFSVYLPTDAESLAGEADALSRPSPSHGAGQLVLMVDDEASIREVAQRTLECFGYRVLTAEDGAAAVALYAQHGREIAVVVVDMMMPILDGAATIVALKALDPNVCIVASSGMASSHYVAATAKAGVKHFVQKPYAVSELLAVISACIEGHAAVR